MSDSLAVATVRPKELKSHLESCLQVHLTPMVWGLPGIGKSEIIAQIAEEYNLKLIDIRLTTCDITDLNGFPDNSGPKATYKVFDTFPVEGDDLPINPKTGKRYTGWLIFLDELPSVNGAMQASAYKLILDRMVGQTKLHERCLLIAAGNDTNHGAISYGMGTAAGTRMIHFNLTTDLDEWVEWAQTKGKLDHRVVSFVQYRDELFHKFDKDSDDKTHPNPRTWSFVSKLIKGNPDIDYTSHHALISGAVGVGAANEFISYVQVYDQLVKFTDIIASPTSARVPGDASATYALTGVIINNTTDKNLDRVVKYVKRLPFEFQVITMRGLIQKNPKFTEQDDFSDLLSDVIMDIT